jgi:hypothetical protein
LYLPSGNDDAQCERFVKTRMGSADGLAALSRPDEFDRMAAREQPVDCEPYGPGDAVDLGGVGFGDDGDAEAPRQGHACAGTGSFGGICLLRHGGEVLQRHVTKG